MEFVESYTQNVYFPWTNLSTPTAAIIIPIEGSFCQEMVRLAVKALPLVLLQLDHQGGREKREVQ